jgi:hypothetical protein
MKHIRLFSIILLITIFIPSLVLADGGIFIPPNYNKYVYLPSQKAAIFWDGTNERMILSTRIKTDDLTNMAWVIPIPSKLKPEVKEGDIQIFYDIANLFSPPRKASTGGWFGAMNLGVQEVEVIELKKVDIYDIAILRATNANVLVDWLNENGYSVPKNTIPILQDYCDRPDFFFIANKINLANKYQNLSISQEDRTCATLIKEHISYSPMRSEDIEYFVEHRSKYIDECNNTLFEAVKVLVELEQGIATPLKITFRPEKPFYPLKISSINEGETEVNVYFFSENPVKDNSNVLSISKMTEVSWLKERYNLTSEKYITFLKYEGNLNSLNKDSIFTSTSYKSSLDPNYVSPIERIAEIVLPILFILIILVIPILIIVGIILLIYFLVKRILRWLKGK